MATECTYPETHSVCKGTRVLAMERVHVKKPVVK